MSRNDSQSAGRRVGIGSLVGGMLIALALGVAIGYLARGEPTPGPPLTIEQELPTVTVTVPSPP